MTPAPDPIESPCAPESVLANLRELAAQLMTRCAERETT